MDNEPQARSLSPSSRSPTALLLTTALVAFPLGGFGCLQAGDLAPDEEVVLFAARATPSADGETWTLPLHGWVFEPERDSKLRGEAIGLLRASLGLGPEDASARLFQERARRFLVDNERGKRIALRVGERTVRIGPSGANGHLEGKLELSRREVDALEPARPGAPGTASSRWAALLAPAGGRDGRVFRCPVELAPGEGTLVISDVDDTIKVSHATDTRELIRRTFLAEAEAVPGMAALYGRWAEVGVSFHYLTACPWQLYELLEAFREESGFPAGTWDMKLFRWKDETLFSLFEAPGKHKAARLGAVAEFLPRWRFVLVGDTGQEDPEAYGDFARAHAGRVEKILLRDVVPGGAPPERFARVFQGLPADLWIIFRDPSEVDWTPARRL